MGHGHSRKVDVHALMHRVRDGDQAAVEATWNYLDKDGSGALEGDEVSKCLLLCTGELLNNWDELDQAKKDALARQMVPLFVKGALDPNNDGKITKEEFLSRVMVTLG
mmetsp:Transcript_29203/g.77155  ORF Transcript_29203/g.77155 Transcript_29203/m.77155 type:complete len:108 (-) Transcript_29203:62-385(-)